jgi:GntR family transcriptional repressor for pyruvate dehydrogenase complex
MAQKEFKIIKQEPIFQQIISQIREMILDGHLKSGDRLPPERKLSEMMGVNRHTLREALKALEYMGVVQGKTGIGTVVNSVGQDVLVDRISIATLFSPPQFLFELLEVRKILEPGIAVIATEKATHKNLAELKESIHRIETDLKTGKHSDADISFHIVLAKATQNNTLVRLMEPLMSMQLQYREGVKRIKDRRSDAFNEHMRIYQAVKDRKPIEARAAMNHHLTRIEKLLFRLEADSKKKTTTSESDEKEKPNVYPKSKDTSGRFNYPCRLST